MSLNIIHFIKNYAVRILCAAAVLTGLASASTVHAQGLPFTPHMQVINPSVLQNAPLHRLPSFALLQVERTSGWPPYCRLAPNGGLEVRVKNRGTAQARRVAVKTTFQVWRRGSMSATQTIPLIGAGATQSVVFGFPRGCFNANCHFTIEIPGLAPIDGQCIG